MARRTKRRRRKSGHRVRRRTPRAGARMTGTRPIRRSARIAAQKSRAKSKAAFTMTGMFDALEVKSTVRTVKKTGRKAAKKAKKTTAKAEKIAKTLANKSVSELSDLFSAFKL